jgi:hypothetical protein
VIERSEHKHARSASSPTSLTPRSSRRVFLRHAGTMLAIAIPALRLLAEPINAAACTFTAPAQPDAGCTDCCAQTYPKLDYTGCGIPNSFTGCPTGEEDRCWGNYTLYSVPCRGYVCGQETIAIGTCTVI